MHILSLVTLLFCCLNRDCVMVDDGPKTEAVAEHKCHGRIKLLQFRENYRPAYWGTWSKKSTHISPRCPFRLDKVKTFELFLCSCYAKPGSMIIHFLVESELKFFVFLKLCVRICLITRWTAMRNGKKRSQESPCRTVKG